MPGSHSVTRSAFLCDGCSTATRITMVGDGYLFSRLRRLGDPALAHPLVAFTGDCDTMRGCTVALTEAGQSVLEGRQMLRS